MFLLFLVTALQSQVMCRLSVQVTGQVVAECLAHVWGCAGKTPSHDCWVRVSGVLGTGQDWGWSSEAPPRKEMTSMNELPP